MMHTGCREYHRLVTVLVLLIGTFGEGLMLFMPTSNEVGNPEQVDVGTSSAADDLITKLPGQPANVSFRQYSGYLKAVGTRRLHYWFVESEGNVSVDPIIVWFNGGPGCSSLASVLEGNGPFRVRREGDKSRLVMNPYRWNRVASMLYIESPAGTGFSYSTDSNHTVNDHEATENNYAAIKQFLLRFPNFVGHPLYVFGQSYGGVYVPLLTDMIKDDPEINLKGFGIGNGLVDYKYIFGSLFQWAYYHGLFGEEKWREAHLACCSESVGLMEGRFCDFSECENGKYMEEARGLIQLSTGINVYDYAASCSTGVNENLVYYRLFLTGDVEASALHMGYACVDSTDTILYLNEAQVKTALHIPQHSRVYDQPWRMCSHLWGYKDSSRRDMTTRDEINRVLSRMDRKGLLYYGDLDIICNFLGGRWFAESLGKEKQEDHTRWLYQDEAGRDQVGGYVTKYSNLHFVTIKGGSHMVPRDSPQQAFVMLVNFLQRDSTN